MIQVQVTGTQSKSGRFLAYGTEECKNCTASGTAGSRDANDAVQSGLPRLPSLPLLPLPSLPFFSLSPSFPLALPSFLLTLFPTSPL